MPRLTEQKRQEIIRFIEGDKPLPEKYRFLLFEEKREVELVWNGKTNEVCNIVLPFQTRYFIDALSEVLAQSRYLGPCWAITHPGFAGDPTACSASR